MRHFSRNPITEDLKDEDFEDFVAIYHDNNPVSVVSFSLNILQLQ